MLVMSTTAYIAASINISLFNEISVDGWDQVKIDALNARIESANKFFFRAQAVWMLILCFVAIQGFRLAKILLLTCAFKCLAWFSASNLFDELFAIAPHVKSPQEYWWAGVAVIDCVLEYHGTTIPKFAVWLFQKILSYLNKTWTLIRKKWPRRKTS